MLVERLRVKDGTNLEVWPYTVPAVGALARSSLKLSARITVLVGANGSGKSTIVEAVAEAYGIDVRGGHGARQYGSDLSKSRLGEDLILDRTRDGARFTGRRSNGFFLRAETAAGMLAFMSDYGVRGYGEKPAASVSHGESYLQAILGRFTGPGLYLLDEAEGPLSFESTLQLLFQLQSLVESGEAQVIYATHSPLVAALPGAQIVELNDDGFEECAWESLQMVSFWRAFLARPDKFFEQ